MKKRMTIAKAFKNIAQKTENSQLTQELMDTLSAELAYLRRKLRLNPIQCYLVVVCLERTGT